MDTMGMGMGMGMGPLEKSLTPIPGRTPMIQLRNKPAARIARAIDAGFGVMKLRWAAQPHESKVAVNGVVCDSSMENKDKIVRVGVNFNVESSPEWHELLSKTSSGRVRADMLRAHLNPPSAALLERFSNTPVHTEPLRKKTANPTKNSPNLDAKPESDQILTVDKPISEMPSIVNSRDENTKFTGSFLPPVVPEKPKKPNIGNQNFGNSPVASDVGARRSGMASMLISKGLSGVGES